MAVGEHLGYLSTSVWTFLIALLMLRAPLLNPDEWKGGRWAAGAGQLGAGRNDQRVELPGLGALDDGRRHCLGGAPRLWNGECAICIGWLVTRAVGVDLAQHWFAFGSSGALTFQLLSGLALAWLLPQAKPAHNHQAASAVGCGPRVWLRFDRILPSF